MAYIPVYQLPLLLPNKLHKGSFSSISNIPDMPKQHAICILQNGKTALDIAVEIGYSEIIEVFTNSQSKVRYTLDHQVMHV